MTSSFDSNLYRQAIFSCLETGIRHLGLNQANTLGASTIRTSIRAISPLQQHRCARVHRLDERALSSLPNGVGYS